VTSESMSQPCRGPLLEGFGGGKSFWQHQQQRSVHCQQHRELSSESDHVKRITSIVDYVKGNVKLKTLLRRRRWLPTCLGCPRKELLLVFF
jgi:hypothetical protein